MRVIESIVVLLVIAVVLAPKIQPNAGEWTSAVKFRDIQLRLDLCVDPCSEIRFHGDLSQSRISISSFEVARRRSCRVKPS
jgi:hypothetical protein